MLTTGINAPDFSARDQHGNEHSLRQYRGQWILVYFYPADDTPGCTKEACTLRDAFANLEKYITIIGISKDSIESHKKFAEKYHLPFALLADETNQIIPAYQATGLLGTHRISYIINPEGIIVKAYPKVTPDKHAAQILTDIQILQK